jgi:hypothetical protein
MLTDPSRTARLRAEHADVEVRYKRFTTASREWQHLLGDGFAVVNSDLDFQLRSRVRAVLSEVELAINSGDPKKNRDAFQAWLRHRLIFEAAIAYQGLHAGAHHVAVRLANLLDLPAPVSFSTPRVTAPEQLVSELPAREPAPHQSPIPARLLTIFMPAYGGIVMALVFSRYLGLVLPGWLIAVCAVVAALTLGGAAASGERSRQRERRQSYAVTAMRSTIDEYQIALIKQLRDGARGIQQDLRRITTDTVSQIRETLTAELDTTSAAANTAGRAHTELADIDDDLSTVADLRRRAEDLLNAPLASTRNLVLLTGEAQPDPHPDSDGDEPGATAATNDSVGEP